MGRSLFNAVAGFLFLLVSSNLRAQAFFEIPDTEAARGQEGVVLSLSASIPVPSQGFSMALRYDGEGFLIREGNVEGLVTEGADFVSVLSDPGEGTLVIGLLMDSEPPFNGKRIPVLNEPQAVLNLVFDVAESLAHGEYEFSFASEGLRSGSAWIYNTYAAGDESFRVTDLRNGKVTISSKPQGGLPLFVRGDANQDLEIDLADPVTILQSLYGGADLPPCLDACDANDDGKIDVADPIYLLAYTFADGPRPPIPFGEPGLDWTPDPFGCEAPAAGWVVDFWP